MLKFNIVENPTELWNKFAEDIGIENVRAAYGKYWIREKAYRENVWEVYSEDVLVGWCSLRPDPIDPVVWQISGVFPEFSKHKFVRIIFRWCVDKTFSEWENAEAMFYSVSKSNTGFLEWNMKKVKEEEDKIVVGDINFPPPGYVIFAVVNKGKEK